MTLLDQEGYVLLVGDCILSYLDNPFQLKHVVPTPHATGFETTWHNMKTQQAAGAFVPLFEGEAEAKLLKSRLVVCERCPNLLACTLEGVEKAMAHALAG